jgi:hypothetical protein
MKPRRHPFIVVAAFALSQGHASAVMAQELHFTHGAEESGQVRTNRSRITMYESRAHAHLPSSALKVELQPGDNDLFVFEFDAECLVFAGSSSGLLSVQARLNGDVAFAGISYLQPQDSPTDLHAWTSGEGLDTISKS